MSRNNARTLREADRKRKRRKRPFVKRKDAVSPFIERVIEALKEARNT